MATTLAKIGNRGSLLHLTAFATADGLGGVRPSPSVRHIGFSNPPRAFPFSSTEAAPWILTSLRSDGLQLQLATGSASLCTSVLSRVTLWLEQDESRPLHHPPTNHDIDGQLATDIRHFHNMLFIASIPISTEQVGTLLPFCHKAVQANSRCFAVFCYRL